MLKLSPTHFRTPKWGGGGGTTTEVERRRWDDGAAGWPAGVSSLVLVPVGILTEMKQNVGETNSFGRFPALSPSLLVLVPLASAGRVVSPHPPLVPVPHHPLPHQPCETK